MKRKQFAHLITHLPCDDAQFRVRLPGLSLFRLLGGKT